MAWVKCSSCGFLQPAAVFHSGAASRCTTCRNPLKVRLLPAIQQQYQAATPPPMPEQPLAPGETACFYSPSRRATKSCDHCGVYISDAWAATWGNQTVCLKCLDTLRKQSQDITFQTSRRLWDNIALALSIGPYVIAIALSLTLVLYWLGAILLLFTVITAPAAVFVGLRYWNAPRSLVPRGRFRLITAILLALLQIAGWGLAGYSIYEAIMARQ